MQISRDLTQRPGVGTLMFMGDGLPASSSTEGMVTIGAGAAALFGKGLLRWAGIGVLAVQAYRYKK